MLVGSDRVGIVLVTSPARSHPSTDIIWGALGSTSLLRGLDAAPITVVCDGCRTPADLSAEHAVRAQKKLDRDPCATSKRGIVANEIGQAYEEYQARLRDEILRRGLSERISVESLSSHHGFALCVRHGLEHMRRRGKEYALVVQHDRAFIRRVEEADMRRVLEAFETDATTRYVGFPSSTSKGQATRLQPKYKLGRLLDARTRPLRDGLMLRPTIFWWDSNHLLHIDRGLRCLYQPFLQAPPVLRAVCAERHGGLGAFTLRPGDFIEDRFGTEQRAVLTSMHAAPEEELLEAFDFFGSYVIEEVAPEEEPLDFAGPPADAMGGVADGQDGPPTVCDLLDHRRRASHVAHIDARGSRPRAWLPLLPRLEEG